MGLFRQTARVNDTAGEYLLSLRSEFRLVDPGGEPRIARLSGQVVSARIDDRAGRNHEREVATVSSARVVDGRFHSGSTCAHFNVFVLRKPMHFVPNPELGNRIITLMA